MKSGVYSRKHHNPTFKSFEQLFLGLDQVFGSDVSSSMLPATNVLETDENFKIDLVAAGFQKEDFQQFSV